MSEVFMMRGGGNNPLNFSVYMGTQQPASPKENTIWIPQNRAQSWAMGSENPYISFRDEQLLDGVRTVSGYLNDDGDSVTQTSNLEVYTYDMIPVEHLAEYEYSYTLSNVKNQWLAVCEYSASGMFIRRTVLVNSVSGKTASGVYKPQDLYIGYVRVMWRTFDDSSCSVTLMRRNAPYTPEGIDEAVWVDTSERFAHVINVLKERTLNVHVGAARLYRAGDWISTYGNKIFTGGAWADLPDAQTVLYDRGNQVQAITGGWTKVSGTVNFESGYIFAANAAVSTAGKVDLTDAKRLLFEVRADSGSARTTVGVGTTTAKDEYAASGLVPYSTIEYGMMAVDVSQLKGEYYIKFQTAAGVAGCYIRHVTIER